MGRTEYHYWIVSREPESGKPYLIYGGVTEGDARQKALEILQGLNFVLKRFPTKSLQTASAMLRGHRLKQGMGLKKSSIRQGHEATIKRRAARLRKRRL